MSKRFLIVFTIGSVALLAGSWFHVIPFTITEDLGFITGALTVWLTVVENIWNFPVYLIFLGMCLLGVRAWARSRVEFA